MGQFLSMSGIVGSNGDAVVDALRSYAEANDGSMVDAELTTEDGNCLVVSEAAGGVTVLYPNLFIGFDAVTQYLSKQLQMPAFSFHIHDSDFWMYLLYENDEVVDQFNPVPDYWEELDDDEERRSWQGNAAEVARRVPGLAPEQIARYLVQWGVEVFTADAGKKAYSTDESCYGNDWQLMDFMSKLGLDFPIDSRGAPHGVTYRFECNSKNVG